MLTTYIPIVVMLIVAGLFGAVVIVLSRLVGRRRETVEKLMPYECGIDPRGDARGKFSVQFYIVGVLFIIFDIEAVFLYPWAVIYRELGLYGLAEMGVFIGILLIGFMYVWKKGALEWGSKRS